MVRLSCSEVWGGIKNEDVDACSASLAISLYSTACEGGQGGDVYYLSVCGADMLTRVALADVRGHGEAVSSVSQWLYDCLQARMDCLDGNEILSDLNHLALQRGFDALTTAVLLGLYRGSSTAYLSYAGHPPVISRNCTRSEWKLLPVPPSMASRLANLPLGVDEDVLYEQQQFPVCRGDRYLMYTDGLIEARDAKGELFGQARLQAVLREAGAEPLHQLKSAILEALRSYTGGELTHDDVTLLALEVL